MVIKNLACVFYCIVRAGYSIDEVWSAFEISVSDLLPEGSEDQKRQDPIELYARKNRQGYAAPYNHCYSENQGGIM